MRLVPLPKLDRTDWVREVDESLARWQAVLVSARDQHQAAVASNHPRQVAYWAAIIAHCESHRDGLLDARLGQTR